MTVGKILLLGDINIDSFWPVLEFPVPGRDGLVDEVSFEIGGAVFNTAVCLDRMGAITQLLSCLGQDRWGDTIQEALKESSIDFSSIQIISTAMTGINFTIVTPDGERTMFTHRGANVRHTPESLKEEDFKDAKLLHISGYALLEAPQKDTVWRAVELANQYDVPISLDTGLEPVMKRPDDFRSLINQLTICITGQDEMDHLYGASSAENAVDQLLQRGVELGAIKMGNKGSLVADHTHLCSFPCFQVEVVDSTGAGDSFSAGIIFGWLNKFSLDETAVLADALGGLATTVYGAGMSSPTKETLIEFLRGYQNPLPDNMRIAVGKLINRFE